MTQNRRARAPKAPTSLRRLNSLGSVALVLAATLINLSPAFAGEPLKQEKPKADAPAVKAAPEPANTAAAAQETKEGASTETKSASAEAKQASAKSKQQQPAPAKPSTAAAVKSSVWTQAGIASYYSRHLHGGPTASGERYNQNILTAAHKSLPMNTMVEVTRVDTGRKVIVRINDRGPFIKGRVIDLSMAAAKQLDMVARGLAKVNLRILPPAGSGRQIAQVEEAMIMREAQILPDKKEFALALVSFEEKAEAQRFRERMVEAQLEAATVKKIKETSGLVKYRVEIPGFATEAEARAQREELSQMLLNRTPVSSVQLAAR